MQVQAIASIDLRAGVLHSAFRYSRAAFRVRMKARAETSSPSSIALSRGAISPPPNVLGRQLRIPTLPFQNNRLAARSAQGTAWRQIIGIAAPRINNDDRPVVPAIYFPYTHPDAAIRGSSSSAPKGEPLTCLHSIRAAIAAVASDQQAA